MDTLMEPIWFTPPPVRGRYVHGLWKSKTVVPAPDPNIGIAAANTAAISKEALDFQKQMYEEYKPYMIKEAATAEEASRLQMDIARKQDAQADEYGAYMKNTFRPVEQSMVDEAMSYDNGVEGERMAGEAAAQVGESFGIGQRTMNRQMADQGVNVNDGAYAGGQRFMALKQAVATAGATNKARQDAKTIGWAKKADAAGLGRNLPGNQATAASLATSAAGAGVQSAGVGANGVAQGASLMQQGYGTAIQGNNTAGNLYLGQYNAQMEGYKASTQANNGLWSGLGTLAGAALGKWG